MFPKALLIIAAAALLTGCTTQSQPAGGTTCVSFYASVPAAAVKGDANLINNLEILVFRSADRVCVSHAAVKGGGPITLTLSSGTRFNYHLYANLPEGKTSGILWESDLENIKISIENSPEQMHAEGDFSTGGGSGVIRAELERFACKIHLGAISVPWLDDYGPWRPECRLTRIMVLGDGDSPVREVNMDLPVEEGESATVDSIFYLMPIREGGRVCLCLSVGGEDNWFAAYLPPMEGNKCYSLEEIVITGPGADSPDGPVERLYADFEIRVSAWEESPSDIEFN